MTSIVNQPAWIQDNIEELSRILILVEPSDLPMLADLHGRMKRIEDWTAEQAMDLITNALHATADLIEKIILEEVPDQRESMDVAGRTVSALQAIFLEGRNPADVVFPEELGISPTEDERESVAIDPLGSIAPPSTAPALIDPVIFADFINRQDAVLEEMEQHILGLEKPDWKESRAELRRTLHTMKGDAGMLGLIDVERACHQAEDALDLAHHGKLTDLLLGLMDWFSKLFAAYAGKGTMPGTVDPLLRRLVQATVGNLGRDLCPPEPPEAVAENKPMFFEGDPALLAEFINEAREHLESVEVHLLALETDSHNEDDLNSVFRAFHTIKGVAGLLGLGEIGALAHEAENLLDKARKHDLLITSRYIDAIFNATDVLKRLVDRVRIMLETGQPMIPDADLPPLIDSIRKMATQQNVDDSATPAFGPSSAKLGDILIESGAATREDIEAALQIQMEFPGQLKLGQVLVENGHVQARDVAQALRSQKGPALGNLIQVKETVKVDADRLDRLVEMIGELVIAESMVSQSSELRASTSAGLIRQLNELDKITRELQEMGMSLRMVPLSSAFQKMTRLVRDLSKKSSKKVELVLVGEDTELDKTVVDRIGDPLVHMIRNAVDHGLESDPEARLRAGKPETGRIELRAFHRGGNIYIEVEDDGRGLDREAILAKGRERGLIREGESLTDREIFNLIFQPGFSTAKKLTDISGRGVGLDVVKRNIDSLRGMVEIRSEPGRGTTFSIRLPLTLAIIDGMVVRVGNERYIIPTLRVVVSLRPDEGSLTTVLGRAEMLSLTGEQIPLHRLSRIFNVSSAEEDPRKAIAIVVEDAGHRAGLLVDELLGQQQIVIKSLGESMAGIPGISGGAIMPDGRVGLILDVGGLIRLAQAQTCNLEGSGKFHQTS